MNDEVATGHAVVLLGLDLAVPYLPELCYLAGAILILLGWVGWLRGCRWSPGSIFLLIGHPQYLGVLLIALGLFIRWATLPFLSIWPLLILLSSWVAGQDRFGPERGLHEALRGYGDGAVSLLSRLQARCR